MNFKFEVNSDIAQTDSNSMQISSAKTGKVAEGLRKEKYWPQGFLGKKSLLVVEKFVLAWGSNLGPTPFWRVTLPSELTKKLGNWQREGEYIDNTKHVDTRNAEQFCKDPLGGRRVKYSQTSLVGMRFKCANG